MLILCINFISTHSVSHVYTLYMYTQVTQCLFIGCGELALLGWQLYDRTCVGLPGHRLGHTHFVSLQNAGVDYVCVGGPGNIATTATNHIHLQS